MKRVVSMSLLLLGSAVTLHGENEKTQASTAASQAITKLHFYNEMNEPITIAYSYNIDPERKSGNEFPKVRGMGRAKSKNLEIKPKTTLTVSFEAKHALKVPENLPLRITWSRNGKDYTQDIVVTPAKNSEDFAIHKVMRRDGSIGISISWDGTYGKDGSALFYPFPEGF